MLKKPVAVCFVHWCGEELEHLMRAPVITAHKTLKKYESITQSHVHIRSVTLLPHHYSVFTDIIIHSTTQTQEMLDAAQQIGDVPYIVIYNQMCL